jgi:energy-coupling factor transporter transmembrane protein EcfT
MKTFLYKYWFLILLIPVFYFLNPFVAAAIFAGLYSIIQLLIYIYKTNWIKVSLYVFITGIIFIINWIVFQIYFGAAIDNYDIGNDNWYKDEIKTMTKLDLTDETKIIYRIDTIRYRGIEGEYTAECLIVGPSTKLKEYAKILINDSTFSKTTESGKNYSSNQNDNYGTINKSKFDKETIITSFTKHVEGRYYLSIAFNQKYTKMIYNASYY